MTVFVDGQNKCLDVMVHINIELNNIQKDEK